MYEIITTDYFATYATTPRKEAVLVLHSHFEKHQQEMETTDEKALH